VPKGAEACRYFFGFGASRVGAAGLGRPVCGFPTPEGGLPGTDGLIAPRSTWLGGFGLKCPSLIRVGFGWSFLSVIVAFFRS